MQHLQPAIKLCIYSLAAANDPYRVHTCSWMTILSNCPAHLKSTADLKPDAGDCIALKSGLTLIGDAVWKMSPSATFSVSHP